MGGVFTTYCGFGLILKTKIASSLLDLTETIATIRNFVAFTVQEIIDI